MIATIIASIAAFFTTISFIPQVLQTIATRRTKDISVGMYGCFTFGVLTWVIYGIVVVEWPIIIANAVTFILAGIVLMLKIQNG